VLLTKFASQVIPELQFKLFRHQVYSGNYKDISSLGKTYFNLTDISSFELLRMATPFEIPDVHRKLTVGQELRPAWLDFLVNSYIQGSLNEDLESILHKKPTDFTQQAINTGLEFILHSILGNVNPQTIMFFFMHNVYKTQRNVNYIFKAIGAEMYRTHQNRHQ
jgi:hypothetical protein